MGGFDLVDPAGAKIWSKNITPDEATGIGKRSVDDFERAVGRGITLTVISCEDRCRSSRVSTGRTSKRFTRTSARYRKVVR